MDYKNDIWKPIKGFEGFYEVNSIGGVRRIARYNGAGIKPIPRPLANHRRNDGYHIIYLTKSGVRYKRYLHRAVGEAFIKNPHNKRCINHLDGNKSNNRVDNLEWCTYSENIKHAHNIGLMRAAVGEDSGRAKITEKQAREIKYKHRSTRCKLVAKVYGISVPQVYKIWSGYSWRHI